MKENTDPLEQIYRHLSALTPQAASSHQIKTPPSAL